MWNGTYGFFDWKYNIAGYSGQDYDGIGRYVYLIASVVLLLAFSILFRKAKKESVRRYLKVISIFLPLLYVAKTAWESYFDITVGAEHAFNVGLLPFDTCSIIMLAAPLAAFGKGRVERLGLAWLATGGIVGGISNLLFLQALHYYPFWTFGAFYSMIWHFLMVFTGVWLFVTNCVEANFKTVVDGFILHMAYSVIAIPVAYLTGMDFMLYLNAGGAPLIENLGSFFRQRGMMIFTTIIMIGVYFLTFAFVTYAAKGIKLLFSLGKRKPQENAQ